MGKKKMWSFNLPAYTEKGRRHHFPGLDYDELDQTG